MTASMSCGRRISALTSLLLLWGCAGNEGEPGAVSDEAGVRGRHFGPTEIVCDGREWQPRTLRVPRWRARGIIDAGGYEGPCAVYGDKRTLGERAMQTYAQLSEDGRPWAIGLVAPGGFFEGLPQLSSHEPGHHGGAARTDFDGENCYDVNGNGTLELDGSVMPDNPLHHDECIGGYQIVMDFPVKENIAPFKWALVNWINQGHTPNGIYDIPHFDFHFFTLPYRERNFIRLGPCGLLINCDDYERAVAPLAEGFLHPDYISVGAAEARMGDHRVDATAKEWHGERFTDTFIFGAYDAKTVFWEPMITREYLESQPNVCVPIKVPELYSEAGWYPTQYCMHYRESRDEYTISLRVFEYREAS